MDISDFAVSMELFSSSPLKVVGNGFFDDSKREDIYKVVSEGGFVSFEKKKMSISLFNNNGLYINRAKPSAMKSYKSLTFVFKDKEYKIYVNQVPDLISKEMLPKEEFFNLLNTASEALLLNA